MVRLTDILDKVTAYHPTADADLINKAYIYAARMHEGQQRKSGDRKSRDSASDRNPRHRTTES